MHVIFKKYQQQDVRHKKSNFFYWTEQMINKMCG